MELADANNRARNISRPRGIRRRPTGSRRFGPFPGAAIAGGMEDEPHSRGQHAGADEGAQRE